MHPATQLDGREPSLYLLLQKYFGDRHSTYTLYRLRIERSFGVLWTWNALTGILLAERCWPIGGI